MGEGAGGQNQFSPGLVPPPLHPLPPKGGEILGGHSDKVRDKFSDFMVLDSKKRVRVREPRLPDR